MGNILRGCLIDVNHIRNGIVVNYKNYNVYFVRLPAKVNNIKYINSYAYYSKIAIEQLHNADIVIIYSDIITIMKFANRNPIYDDPVTLAFENDNFRIEELIDRNIDDLTITFPSNGYNIEDGELIFR